MSGLEGLLVADTVEALPGRILPGLPIVFETRHRVRFREIDANAHMNMAHYLVYFGDHRFEGMRLFMGLGLKELEALPIAFHIRHVDIDYQRPLFGDQEFIIRSHISELKRSQCYVDFDMQDLEGQRISTCRMRIGCIARDTQRPCGWPKGLMERFFR